MRRVVVAVGASLLLAACSGTPPPEGPRLAVIIVVDGLSQEMLLEHREIYTAGLARLLDEGRVEAACHYRHLNTSTGPGHASIATGAPPRVHGIVSNRWMEPGADGELRSILCTVSDPDSPIGESERAAGSA